MRPKFRLIAFRHGHGHSLFPTSSTESAHRSEFGVAPSSLRVQMTQSRRASFAVECIASEVLAACLVVQPRRPSLGVWGGQIWARRSSRGPARMVVKRAREERPRVDDPFFGGPSKTPYGGEKGRRSPPLERPGDLDCRVSRVNCSVLTNTRPNLTRARPLHVACRPNVGQI